MVLFTAAFTVLFIALVLWYINYFQRRGLPPGPFRLPLFGNLIQLSRWSKKSPHTHIMLQSFSRKYGPVAAFRFGSLEQVVLDDYETIREILQNDNWGQRPLNTYILDRSYGKPFGILWSRGNVNKEMRRFTLRTLRDFGFGKQKNQDVCMEEELTELMTKLNAKLESEGPTVSMQQFFNLSVLNIIWSMVAGVRFNLHDPKTDKLVNSINKTMRLLAGTGNILLAFPVLRHFLPWLTGYGSIRTKCIPQLHNFFMEICNERRRLGDYKDNQKDFIDVYLCEMDKQRGNPIGQIYTEKQFTTTVMDIFVAGSETSSNSLEFLILYMMQFENIQKKVQEEIDQVIGRIRFPNYEDKQNMPFTEATILETLRFSSVVPVIVRCPLEDTKVGSFNIPKETWTILNTYSAHRNPFIWDQPETFNPERFLKDGKIVNGEKLIPFGLGKRYCLGDVLAKASLFTFFVTMLQNYSFSKSPDHPQPSLDGLPGITLSPHPYYAVIKRRI